MIQTILFDIKKTTQDLTKRKTDWRRLGLQVLPVGAAAVVATGCLLARKRSDPPAADFLRTPAVCFGCRSTADLAAEGLLPSPVEVERCLVAVGVDIVALRRAASRLRGPIESDIVVVEAKLREAGGDRVQAYRELADRWREAGYLDEPVVEKKPRWAAKQHVDMVTKFDESYGHDVGSNVPLLLLAPPNGTTNMHSLPAQGHVAAARSLEDHGVVLLTNLLGKDDVMMLRERMQLQVSALDRRHKNPFAPVREYSSALLEELDEGLKSVVSTPGRRHFYLRGRALEEAVSFAQAGAMPVIWEHLMRAAEAAGLPRDARPYVSEVQLLVTDPCAEDQWWHVDNTAPGLTLFIPITTVREDIGPTIFLPGSHHTHVDTPGRSSYGERLRAFASSYFSADGAVAGSMEAGDALLYDSRIIHRGSANRKYDRTRVALLFRYDFERPPGVGPWGTQAFSWIGNALSVVQSVYAALPSGVAKVPST